MKRLGTVVALAVVAASLGAGVQPASATGQGSSGYHNGHHFSDHVVVEDDPYTVLKPTITTYSQVVKSGKLFALRLEGFEPRERVKITLDGTSYNRSVWASGSGFVRLRAPRKAGEYEIVAVGRSSDAIATTDIKVRRR